MLIKRLEMEIMGAIRADSIFRQIPVTGRIGAFLITFFRILTFGA